MLSTPGGRSPRRRTRSASTRRRARGTASGGYYRWQVYCRTTAGEVWPPVGYEATEPIPVAEYLATHPR